MNQFATGILTFTILLAGVGFSQDAPKPEDPKPDNKPASPLRKLLDESLSWNELYPGEQSAEPMSARVALRWANNTRGSEDGMTVLYIANGRPEAVCCIYPWEKSLIHEFDSLSRKTLIAKRNGVVVWRPESAGLTFKSIPEAEAPSDSAAARLRQMKTLAGQFSSTMLGWRANKSDRESLRLLPQPLYRYESKRSDLLDGAVFAFVQGTDPESLLLIEAVQLDGQFQWQYAFARRTSGELEGRHKDVVVWHAEKFPPSNNPRSTHFSLAKALDPAILGEVQEKSR